MAYKLLGSADDAVDDYDEGASSEPVGLDAGDVPVVGDLVLVGVDARRLDCEVPYGELQVLVGDVVLEATYGGLVEPDLLDEAPYHVS
ncbi:hypothetical protein ES703_43630 [subsurface metagenome]